MIIGEKAFEDGIKAGVSLLSHPPTNTLALALHNCSHMR